MRRHRLDFLAVGVAVIILAAVPFLLASTAGWPLPTSWAARTIWTSRGVLALAATSAWIAWVACCIPLCRRVAERVRTRDTESLNEGHGVDWLAARIATAILAVVPASVASAAAVGAVPSRENNARSLDVCHSTERPKPQVSVVASGASSAFFPSSTSCRTAGFDWVSSATNHGNARYTAGGIRAEVGATRHLHLPNPDLWSSSGGTLTAASRATDHHLYVSPETWPKISLVDIPVLLSDLATAGLSCLGTTALARRLRPRQTARRRNPQRLPRVHDEMTGPTPLPIPAVGVFEIAAKQIQGLLAELVPTLQLRGAPPIRLVRSGMGGLEFFLADKVEWSPEGWSLGGEGRSWMVKDDATSSAATTSLPPGCPLILPLGQDSKGTWAAVIAPKSSIAILGSNAQSLVSSLDALARRPPWSESVQVQSKPDGLVLVWSIDSSGSSSQKHAFVTTSHTDAADLTIIADSRALTIHPDGLSLLPFASTTPVGHPISDVTASKSRPAPVRSLGSYSDTAGSPPGDLEVRLLTVVPAIDGLREALPPKRARRAIEVVAYLALHHPDPISGDRLRTRVLGSPDSDAAAKTLFNTVGAARRALGSDSLGQPYLPNASRYGHYRLSEAVTLDVTRATRLVVAAKTANSPHESIALYRAAFELVKGEPLAGALSGYSWWRSEGHEARLTATIVDAACRAVRLAIDEGLLDLATWIIEKSRLVDPYSELLSRAALAAAAASGDRTRLLREWDECRRRANELDPGGLPSQEAELLFDLLNRKRAPISFDHQASFAAIDDAP